jgi:hypothetical protein
MMKRFSPAEILAYAKRQVAHAEQQRFVTPIMGLLILAIPIWTVYALKEKSHALGAFLLLDEHFLLGVAFGVMFIMLCLIGGMAVTSILRRLKGIEYQALKRLIELEKEKTENQASEATSEPAPSAASSSPQG